MAHIMSENKLMHTSNLLDQTEGLIHDETEMFNIN